MPSRILRHYRNLSGLLPSAAILMALTSAPCLTAVAARPSAMKLFPEESVVFLRVANAHEFGERLQQTSTGRMLADPQLKPFVEHLYGKAGELYAEKAESTLGISWDDLKKLPKGEVAFAVIARKVGTPAFLLLVDQGEEPSVARRLLDRALEIAKEKVGELTTEKIGDVEVNVVRDANNQNQMVGAFEKENTIVVATDPDVLRNVLAHWDGAVDAASSAGAEAAPNETKQKDAAEFIPGRTLAQNERFTSILSQCRRPQDPPPHLIFFVDPIEFVRNVGRDNGGMQFALGMLPALGIDGLQGIGGAITYATDQYDSRTQVHLLLENPRAGVMQLPAFQPGETTPQAFVPQAVESYITFNWNMRASYDRVAALVDRFRYKGSVDKFVKERLSDGLGIDVPEQVIANLKGRFIWMIGYDRPSHFRGGQHVFAAEVVDEAAATETLNSVIAKLPDLFEERHFGSVTYHAIVPKGLKDMAEEDRPVQPFVAIMDGYFFIGGSCQQFERCIAARDGTVERLIDSKDYARTSEVIGRETSGTTPVLFSISRMEETLRQWYDLLTSEKTRSLIDEHKESNPLLRALAETMDEQKLPPFDVLLPYMAPSGGILYDTDTGYHGISFTLRNAEQ
jgi:hypothetical protein